MPPHILHRKSADRTYADLGLAPPTHRRHRAVRAPRLAAFIVCAITGLGTLTACSLPNLSMSSNVRKSHPPTSTSRASVGSMSAKPTVTPTTLTATTVTPIPARPRPAGDLDTGSLTHKVAVGPFSAVIVYYTADNAKLYRSSSTKTIRIAVHIEGAPSTQNILVNDFVATADDGVTRVVVKHDARSFAITPPQSYNSIVTIPSTTDKSTAVELIVELNFSVQIKPASKLYSVQTALDNITIPLLSGSHS